MHLFPHKKSQEPTHRNVHINQSLLNQSYPKNRVSNTKYTPFTFLPKNLYEQFSRFMNIYFLLIASLQLWNEVTPVNPISTWGPLIFIFLLSALKEGLDDYKRHKRDQVANEKRVAFIRDGIMHENGVAEDIIVGDIILLRSDEEVPCDLVLLKTSDEHGGCFIQTSNIDGETDLKQRFALDITQEYDVHELYSFKGMIICATPNAEVYRFDSQIVMSAFSDPVSLNSRQLLPQATVVRNVEYVYGVAVYTGNETKLGMNKETPPTKWTKADQFINRITTIVFCFQMSVFVFMGSIGSFWKNSNEDKHEYLRYDLDDSFLEVIIIPLRYLLLMSLMIPISLKVTLDVCKYFYALLIMWDENMKDPETNAYAVATNTAISEDLGQVRYLFTDKTGTLTENIMNFKYCSLPSTQVLSVPIFCTTFEDKMDAGTTVISEELVQHHPGLSNLFLCLAVCNTVIPQVKDGAISYLASSPDEEELVRAANKYGIGLERRNNQYIDITMDRANHRFEILHTFEFNSELKRMSVVLKDVMTGEITIFTKGADEAIFKLLDPTQLPYVDPTRNALERFASQGLRTLCIAYRTISDEEYQEWFPRFFLSNSRIEDREEALLGCRLEIESGLVLCGVTAIEDRLQEGVKETIQTLREAGLVFWMLTGDKMGTALQIARSCSLLSSHEPVICITGNTPERVKTCIEEHFFHKRRASSHEYGVIIDGSSLLHVMKDIQSKSMFMQLCAYSDAVICCRVTPKQKAEVVCLLKDVGYVTLAIGDGGNDVSMIQQAQVGVAILGREGKQASRAADYTITKFRFLLPLLLVHGRLSIYRTAFIAQYSFYKSLIIGFIQVSYGIFSAYSGTSFFNSFCLTAYNIIFTGVPIFFFSLDIDVPISTLLRDPSHYREAESGKFMNAITFFSYFARAVYQACIILVVTIFSFNYTWAHVDDGSPMDYESISMISFTALIVIQTITLALETRYFTILNHIVIWGACLLYFFTVWTYNLIEAFDMYTVMNRLFGDPSFWLSVVVIVHLAIVPVEMVKTAAKNHSESDRFHETLEHIRASRRVEFQRRLIDHHHAHGIRAPLFSGSSVYTSGSSFFKRKPRATLARLFGEKPAEEPIDSYQHFYDEYSFELPVSDSSRKSRKSNHAVGTLLL
eukprot:TRINITY_DN5023_c0_g1_i2.p1 TRINITY_DN5023_c0_g1~~TRINITY_DN5023_c0_g1_i2.p1  ORF type:complete len:1147 (-),score=229.78 TRINITY_DN5023_c0_g1_i2:131-3571(-)